jgi:hypothetical protein
MGGADASCRKETREYEERYSRIQYIQQGYKLQETKAFRDCAILPISFSS